MSLPKPYQPTSEEQAILDSVSADNHKPNVQIKIEDENKLAFDHEDQAVGCAILAKALGASDGWFLGPFLSQITNAGSKGPDPQEEGINFMLSVIKGIEPRDQLETMLGAQMAAVHMASMTFARRLAHVDNIAQQDSAERALNKLMRTYTTQMEALKKYRTGGQQKMVVEHVTVNDGGQAIVGTVSHKRGRGANNKR